MNGVRPERLGRAKAARSRGKAYDALIWAYFADIGAVLEHLKRTLAPGGRVVWVLGDSAPYGVYVDTPSLIAALAAEVGFDVLDDILLRTRPTRWTSSPSRHNRSLTERLIVFQRPRWGAQESLPGF